MSLPANQTAFLCYCFKYAAPLLMSWFLCNTISPYTQSLSHADTQLSHKLPPIFPRRIMHLGSVPARLKLINSGFNSTECWLQTLQLRVLKHAPSSLIIKMCVLAKLMNKSLEGDNDWCVSNKQATISCCWKQRRGQTANCRWSHCRRCIDFTICALSACATDHPYLVLLFKQAFCSHLRDFTAVTFSILSLS